MNNNSLDILDILNLLNLGLQVYDIHLNKDDIVSTMDVLKKIEKQNEEIIKLLKKERNVH